MASHFNSGRLFLKGLRYTSLRKNLLRSKLMPSTNLFLFFHFEIKKQRHIGIIIITLISLSIYLLNIKNLHQWSFVFFSLKIEVTWERLFTQQLYTFVFLLNLWYNNITTHKLRAKCTLGSEICNYRVESSTSFRWSLHTRNFEQT